jgi:hypothetical protein
MTEYEAMQIEEAAYLILRAVVDAGFGSADTKAAKQLFPLLHPDVQGTRISLQTAREVLERLPAWIAAKESHDQR